MLRHAEAAVAERRRTGDREAIAIAIADLARTHRGELVGPGRGLAIAVEAWSEFSDLEQTPAGVALMGAIACGHRGLDNNQDAMAWADRLLPIAERLGLLEDTIRGLIGRGTTLLTVGRPREGMIVMRGVHQLAIANDVRDLELNARVLMTFFEQWGEPAAASRSAAKDSRSAGGWVPGRTGSRWWAMRASARSASASGTGPPP